MILGAALADRMLLINDHAFIDNMSAKTGMVCHSSHVMNGKVR